MIPSVEGLNFRNKFCDGRGVRARELYDTQLFEVIKCEGLHLVVTQAFEVIRCEGLHLVVTEVFEVGDLRGLEFGVTCLPMVFFTVQSRFHWLSFVFCLALRRKRAC